MINIPNLDFSLFKNNDFNAKQTLVTQIHQACHEVGFMYLQNHGISQSLIEQIFIHSREFFSLPLEIKQHLAWSDEHSNQGYVAMNLSH